MRTTPAPMRMAAAAGYTVFLAACGSTEPRVPASIVLNATTLNFTALGETQQLSPTITDQDGKTLPPETATWSTSDPAVATVSQTGLVTALGSGLAQITAEAGSATASAQASVVQTPAEIEKISGDAQAAPAGSTLPAPLVVQVNDARGNPVPNATVVFTVTQGDGTTSSSTALTGPDGRASTSYTTGTVSGSAQVVSATIETTSLSVSFTATAAADPSAFNIGVRFITPATPAQRQAFTDARLRWETAITGDLEDGFLASPAGDCATGQPAVNQDVDDVLILVSLVEIDGPGGVLGGAGPCYVRDFGVQGEFEVGDLTILGTMQFDTDDLETLEAEGFLSSVILHEMGHVLGFGTLWSAQGLLIDPVFPGFPDPENPGADPHFVGSQGLAAFNNVGGVAYTASAKVPVENSGGAGTADGHWRESVFDLELMTGFIGAGTSPLSVVTLASLADQGYQVDLTKADVYTLGMALRAFERGRTLKLEKDILRRPIRKVDVRGRVTGTLR
jgi:Leishmanolysin/Bacterial Ig-like domain (group 2)/Bacterial Ig-like domain (group 1)